MHDNDWRSSVSKSKPLVSTGRKLIPIEKYPKDLDFSKTIGGTTYIVGSHFNPNASECLLTKVSRLFVECKDLSE